jgi:hypothetical protein
MIPSDISTRRDPRHALRPGTYFVEFPRPLSETQDARVSLTHISVAGLAFQLAGMPGLETGSTVKGVTVRIGDCRLEGDVVVQYVDSAKAPAVEVGCLFYPAGRDNADRLMALIAGIEATRTGA